MKDLWLMIHSYDRKERERGITRDHRRKHLTQQAAEFKRRLFSLRGMQIWLQEERRKRRDVIPEGEMERTERTEEYSEGLSTERIWKFEFHRNPLSLSSSSFNEKRWEGWRQSNKRVGETNLHSFQVYQSGWEGMLKRKVKIQSIQVVFRYWKRRD